MEKTPSELREDIFKKLIQYHARNSRKKKERQKEIKGNEAVFYKDVK